jgi:hypothetical protein
MISKKILTIALALTTLLTLSSCSRDESTMRPAPANTDPNVFTDTFAPGIDYQAFLNSKYDALQIDNEVRYNGTASLRITVPGPDEATEDANWFAGGTMVDPYKRDLTGFDALTFYARCSKASAAINEVGIGNDNTGTSLYTATVYNLEITNSWKKYYIPIPDPEKLSLEGGLFWFAEGHEDNAGYTIWLDDIIFEKTNVITDPRPRLNLPSMTTYVGTSTPIPGTTVTFNVVDTDLLVSSMPAYFEFFSTDDAVVTVVDGSALALSTGTATLTAELASVAADGDIDFTSLAAPVDPAPVPTVPSSDVISLFSDVYPEWPVDSFSPEWDGATLAPFEIDGDNILLYTNVTYAAIVTENYVVDATEMEYLHLDLWIPLGVSVIGVKLIDYGPDGEYLGGDDSEAEVFISLGSTPPLTPGAWSSLDIPLADYMGVGRLDGRSALAQLYLTGSNITIFADNIYYFKTSNGD